MEHFFESPCTREIIYDTLYWRISLKNTDRRNSLRHLVLGKFCQTPCTEGVIYDPMYWENYLRHPALGELFKTPCTGGII